MHPFNNKKILLGITGGIAGYKAAELCRLLVKAGAEVRVVMTAAACEFVQPLTFQALSGQPVHSELFDGAEDNAMDHIALARWADVMLVAPASANTLSKLASGHADNLLLTLASACNKPIIMVPAMNQQMYHNDALQHAITSLLHHGCYVWGPAAGEQACGEQGPGRMLEPEQVFERLKNLFSPGRLQGYQVLLTAGPTREPVDPVRFLSNRSSGKMGYALAAAMREAGAEVSLITGPVALSPPEGVQLELVETALQMHEAVMDVAGQNDIFIATAAVADYRPAQVSSEKIKKIQQTLSLALVRNPDILADAAARFPKLFTVGFAAETAGVDSNAREKLERKQIDMICANDVSRKDAGFSSDYNALQVYWQDGQLSFDLQPKRSLARLLAEIIADRFLQFHVDARSQKNKTVS